MTKNIHLIRTATSKYDTKLSGPMSVQLTNYLDGIFIFFCLD